MENQLNELMEAYQGDYESILTHLIEQTKKEQLLVENIKGVLDIKKVIIEKQKNLIDYTMKQGKINRLETAVGTVKYTTGRPLEFDESKVTEDYIEITEVRKVNKLKIKADLKAGVNLDRAKVGESKSLSIK